LLHSVLLKEKKETMYGQGRPRSCSKFLVPIDGSSENAFRAASFAIGLSKKYVSELLVVHISNLDQNLQLLGLYGAPYPSDTIAKHIAAAKLESQPWFERIQEEATDQGDSRVI
jgi:nucleotide-binding universal stress UspA family protein